MVTSWIKGFIGRARPGRETSVPGIAPDERFVVVGDIHGRLDLLQALLMRVEDDCPLIFVGDYIDRGDYSAQVLRHLQHFDTAANRPVVCLMGNHEDMLLRFLNEPGRYAHHWFRNGGFQTLASFGITEFDLHPTNEIAEAVAGKLKQVMGAGLLSWLRDRPLIWSSGNVTVVHAALDPDLTVDDQQRQVCLWGHPMFPRRRRADGQWVVHGHTIIDRPRVNNGVVSVDTGAFATNRLTAAEIYRGGVRFVST